MSQPTDPFWRYKRLDELSEQEWESLCDGCGLCCLHKLEDEDSGCVYYTRIACKLLDPVTCHCRAYSERLEQVPDCLSLTPENVASFYWLPRTCAYRLVLEGKDLPQWHHLVCGDRNAVHQTDISLSGHILSEAEVPEEDWENHLIARVP